MAIYFFDKNQTLIKIVPESATFEAIQTQELDDDSLLKDTLNVTVKGDEKLLNAEYMAVKSYKGNAQTFDMYRIVTDTTPDKSMSFTGMSLAPYELNGHILQDLRPANHSLSYTLNRVLDGTDWRLGYIEDGLSNVTTTFYYVSAKEALKELQSLVGCEFVFKVEISGQKITDKWIEVYSEMGNRTKKRFNYGTNALTVVRETNKADIYTALIGRGKGEEVSSGEDNASGQAGYGRKITFEDIEWKKSSGKPLDKPIGQYYLELPQATQVYGIKNIDGTMKARVGIVDFDDEEDKNRLINLTYQQLLVSSRPKVLFKTTVANVGATGIGDTVTIHRHDLNIHYQTRVRKIVRNKLNDNKTQIELGDAVVTPSTKQTKQNNATIKNLNQELEKVKADVVISQTSADGKNTINYGSTEPEIKRTGDTWYRPHPSIASETQMLTWNGTAWELVIDTSDLTKVAREVSTAIEEVEKAVQSAQEADVRANEAIEKAGANADVLTTHQSTLDTIKNTTIPNVNKIASDAMGTAQSALTSASSAMDEAKKADGKIADYVTRNGLVNGTTVDSKINEATGEISKKITTVEGKIDGLQVGGRNLIIRNTETPNRWVGLTGDIAVAINHDTSDYINVEPNTEYMLTKSNSELATDAGFFRWSWYDVDMAYIGRESDSSNEILWKTPNDAHYVRVSYPTDSSPKLEKGNIATDWTPAPEDNYSKEEFAIFESTYNEDVKGINSTLTELSNKKLDGSTYTTFYDNEYKKTAQGVTDTYAKVNKIIDANGNSTDAFAKAVYDRNATRQTADFKTVTDGLVKTATYTAGIDGVKQSITSVEGKIDNLSVGGRNLISKNDIYVENGRLESKLGTKDFVYSQSGHVITGKFPVEVGEHLTMTNYEKLSGYMALGFFDENDVYVERPIMTTLEGEANSYTCEVGEGVTYVRASYPNEDLDFIKLERGNVATDYSPAPEDMLGKADFQIFKGTYESNDQTIKNRLTAIDSGKEGSVLYNANTALSTAQGNSKSITTLNTKVDNFKIGGRNYFSLTKLNELNPTNWVVNAYVYNFKLEPNTEYTLSSDVPSPNGDSNKTGIYFNGSVTSENGVWKGNSVTNISDKNGNIYVAIPSERLYTQDLLDGKYWIQLEKGNLATDWSPAVEDMLGKETFTLFQNEYDETAKEVSRRLKAIDSSEEGSVVTRLNATEKTAGENKNTISKVNKIVTIQDTRSDNQPPKWYRTNYPETTVQEFKLVTAIRDSNIPSESGFGILTTTILWYNTSGGTIQQVFTKDEKRYVRRGLTDDSGWTTWTKMTDQEDIKDFVDSTSTEYQTIRERSNLYERVIGSSSEASVKQNISRIVMTDSAFQTEVVDRQNLLTAMASGTGMTSDPYFDKGVNDLTAYDNGKTGTITVKHTKIPSTTSIPAPKGNDGYRLDIAHGASSATAPNRGGVARNTMSWANGTVVIKFVALLPTGRSFSYNNNGLGTGYTSGWLTDNKGTGKWETYMYYYRFGSSGTFSSFGHLSVTGASTAFSWYLSEYDIINVAETTASKITQLSDNINLKVSKGDISNQININTQGVVIQGNKIALSGQTTVDGDFWAKQVNAVKVNASNITTGTLNASKVTVTNIDANNITSNKTNFVQSVWNSLESSIRIDSGGLLSKASDGSQVYLQNGIVGARDPKGATIGQIGYVYDGGSPTYTIQTSWGANFAIKQRFYDSYTKSTKNKEALSMYTTDDGYSEATIRMSRINVLGDAHLSFHFRHSINGNDNERLTVNGAESVALRARDSTVFAVSNNGTNNFASLHANLNMQGNTVTNTSDIRLKRDIVNDEIDSLSALMKWQHAGFNYINPDMNQDRQFSVIAQSAPDLAFAGEDGYLQVSLNKQVNMTSHALQQHVIKTDDEISQLKAQIASLQDELALLKGDRK